MQSNFNFFEGGGEMGALMREFDWASSPLGPPAGWPLTLKAMIRVLLSCAHPMLIMWGPELVQFYNDAMRKTMGPERHPAALGQRAPECWAEAWGIVGTDIERVMAGEGASWYADKLVPTNRNGQLENTYWTYGYSPIEDESGVRGVLVICNDVTCEHNAREMLKQSYQTLFESMDEGFCVLEMIYDEAGRPVDFRYVEANPAFEKQSGLHDAIGKTIRELNPQIESSWVEIHGKVALTGEPARMIGEAASLHRWFESYAVRIGPAEQRRVAVLFRDITERKRADEALQETAQRLQFTLEAAQIGDWCFDPVTQHTYRSLRHDQCFGYKQPVPEWGLDIFIAHVHPDDRGWVRQEIDHSLRERRGWHFECRVIWPDHSIHWIAVHASVFGREGKPLSIAGIVINVTDRKEVEERARYASLHDPLTGLPNRAMLFEYASRLLPHNRRTGQNAAVLFFDLDRFKPINDTHGHEVGDTVLKEVAKRLSGSLRAEDIVIRLGGDEFVVFLQDIGNAVNVVADITRHILKKIHAPYRVGDLMLTLSASVGISIFPDDGQDIELLISHADMAMYQAKQSGRDDVQFYRPEFSIGTKLQMSIEQQLKSALRSDAFHLCYQPVMDLDTNEIVSVEALLRWQNAEIGADRFVPVAETTGIINPIGRWLQDEASRQYKEWIAHGLPPIPIAINVSVVEFRDKSFVSRFRELLRKHGIDGHALQLELTETAVMDNLEHAVAVLSELKGLGVTVLLDDFGTGYSSLAYLARLPLDKVKIDKSFILRLECDVPSRAVTDAMIALGRTLNLDVIAEGIESERVLDYVSSLGCSQGQGYYLGEPMTGSEFESWYFRPLPERDNAARQTARFH